MPRLVSSTILHRHGSRGPGASELSPFSPDNPIYSQWEAHELEELSSVGRAQIERLGEWFAHRYVQSGLLEAGNGKTHWRSSKSDRAFESGLDFVKGFNGAIGSQAAGPTPLPYDVDADNYFRPWKVFKKEASAIKERINTDAKWIEKAKENEGFLRDVFQQVNCIPTLLQNSSKALWCITYLHALREVETFWPKESRRDELCRALPGASQQAVTSLALWVWEQRFLHCGFSCEMGGRMSVDLLESALNRDHSLNIFSGHDYTILSVLSALRLVDRFEHPTGFGAYLLFEVWDMRTREETEETEENLFVKIIYNPDPFSCAKSEGGDLTTVTEDKEVTLKELSLQDVLTTVQALKDQISCFPPPKAIKGQQSVDLSDSIDFGVSGISATVFTPGPS